jgi:hypothetical protein
VQPLAVRYLIEHVTVKQADQIYRRATQMIGWEVRYFRPLEIEEHHVFFDPTNGNFVDHRHSLDENAPGASLAPDKARALAEKALAEHGYRLAEFELQDFRGEKRKAREDYTFVWQAKPGDPRNVAEEKYRTEVNIAGDEVVSVSDYFKLPEEWVRQRQKSGLANSLLSAVGALLGLIIVVRVIILFVAQVRRGPLPWRTAFLVGAAMAALVVLSELNALATAEQAYSTSISLGTFWLQQGTGLILAPILAGLGIWLLVAFALSLFPEAQRLLRRSGTSAWRRDATLAVILALAMTAAFEKLGAIRTSRWPAYFPPRIDLFPSHLDTWSPALAFLLSAVLGAVLATAGVAVLISVFRSGWSRRAWWIWMALLLLLVALGPSHAHSVREFLAGWIYMVISFAIPVWMVVTFFRDNALAYLAAVFCVTVADPVVNLLFQAARIYQWNGLLLAGLSLVVLGWLLLPERSAAGPGRAASP